MIIDIIYLLITSTNPACKIKLNFANKWHDSGNEKRGTFLTLSGKTLPVRKKHIVSGEEQRQKRLPYTGRGSATISHLLVRLMPLYDILSTSSSLSGKYLPIRGIWGW